MTDLPSLLVFRGTVVLFIQNKWNKSWVSSGPVDSSVPVHPCSGSQPGICPPHHHHHQIHLL